ncbi:MAG: LamG-like jellyroll fold domain-containing protein [Nannocystaceae bacterium]
MRDIDTSIVEASWFPTDHLTHENFDNPSDYLQCELSDDWGTEAITDRHGDLLRVCFVPQNHGEEQWVTLDVPTLGSQSTIAAWILASNLNSSQLVGPGASPAIVVEDERVGFSLKEGETRHTIVELAHDEPNEWAFYVGTISHDGQDTTIRFYKNFDGSTGLVGDKRIADWSFDGQPCPFLVSGGEGGTGPCDAFPWKAAQKASFDDIRVYDRALSEPEIAELFDE